MFFGYDRNYIYKNTSVHFSRVLCESCMTVYASGNSSLMSKDSRVESAIAHWAPRFVSNGILLTDFQEVT